MHNSKGTILIHFEEKKARAALKRHENMINHPALQRTTCRLVCADKEQEKKTAGER